MGVEGLLTTKWILRSTTTVTGDSNTNSTSNVTNTFDGGVLLIVEIKIKYYNINLPTSCLGHIVSDFAAGCGVDGEAKRSYTHKKLSVL